MLNPQVVFARRFLAAQITTGLWRMQLRRASTPKLRGKVMQRLLASVAMGILTCFAAVGSARSDYPDRPITMIVPFAAGGPTDTIARIIGEPWARCSASPSS